MNIRNQGSKASFLIFTHQQICLKTTNLSFPIQTPNFDTNLDPPKTKWMVTNEMLWLCTILESHQKGPVLQGENDEKMGRIPRKNKIDKIHARSWKHIPLLNTRVYTTSSWLYRKLTPNQLPPEKKSPKQVLIPIIGEELSPTHIAERIFLLVLHRAVGDHDIVTHAGTWPRRAHGRG